MASLSFNYFKKDKSLKFFFLTPEQESEMTPSQIEKYTAKGIKWASKATIATIFTKSSKDTDPETAKAFILLKEFAIGRGWAPTIQSTECTGSTKGISFCHTVASRPLLNVSHLTLSIHTLFPEKFPTPVIEPEVKPKAPKAKAPKPLEE